MNICLIGPVPPPYGGIGHWVQMVRRHAEARGDVVFSVIDIAPRFRSQFDLSPVKRCVGGGAQLLRDCWRLLSQLQEGPAAVHLTTPGSLAVVRDAVMVRLACWCRVPVVYHLRFGRLAEVLEGRGVRRWLWGQAIDRAAVVVAIDGTTEAAVKARFPDANVVRMPNCIDLGEMPDDVDEGKEQPERVLSYIGHVQFTKGIEELLEAWQAVRRDGWRLELVGPGSVEYIQGLKDRYDTRGVAFRGEKSHADAMKLLARATGFVFPSHTEGFPNAVLEAMALGKPILASDVGAIPEMLSNDCGIVIQARNVEGLKGALTRFMADGDLRKRLGANARRKARSEYSLESVFERYVEIWKAVASKKSEIRISKSEANPNLEYRNSKEARNANGASPEPSNRRET